MPTTHRAVIACSVHSRYDVHDRAGGYVDDDERGRLLAEVRAGVWLRPGEVATVLQVSRSTVINRIADGSLGVRRIAGGRHRRVDPKDILRMLDSAQE